MIVSRHLIICFLVTISFSLSAQTVTTEAEKAVKAEKMAFITQKLNLTPEEAKLFWPIYDEYWDRKNSILKQRRSFMNSFSENMDKLTDEEYNDYTNKYINFYKQETDLLLEFNLRFKSVLPARKVMLLYQADYDFKNYLLKKVSEPDSPDEK